MQATASSLNLQMQSTTMQLKMQSSINVYLSQLSLSNFDPWGLMIRELGYGKEITEAFYEMALMLHKCSQTPKFSAPVVIEDKWKQLLLKLLI